ncbi:MAG: DUF523 and DUF1722 domain-containing protein [Spirochaetia bacterium]|nr:DUF523 and DUF1722 domain-containing protein [Spirochaetia bacterium]
MVYQPRPIVVSSACLEYEKVRYNGSLVPSKFIQGLAPFVEYHLICPEVAIGLGTPRDTIRIVKQAGSLRLIQPATGLDLTDRMNAFTDSFISELADHVDGFIFKSKSPTMGIRKIKVYSGVEKAPVVDTCNGFFAGTIMQRYPDYPIEEDDRLRNRTIQDNFLTRLFLFAAYRELSEVHQEETFHQDNRLLLMLYGPKLFEVIDETDPQSSEYRSLLRRIMHNHPTVETIAAFYTKMLPFTTHQTYFKARIEDFRNNIISRETCRELLRLELIDTELADQSLFTPYPAPLLEGVESDHDKDYWK